MGKKKKKKEKKIGGLVYLLSIVFLFILNGLLIVAAPLIFSGPTLLRNWLYFIGGVSIGGFGGSTIIPARLAVFLHELHHKVLSGLIGNKPKKLVVEKDSGYFEYEYSEETAAYNAFISLAPYFFPMLTGFGLVIALLGWREQHHVAVLITGVGYGLDLYLKLRSVGPYQTDFSSLIGGYRMGVFYVVLITVAMFLILAAWVSNGILGLQSILGGLFSECYLLFDTFVLKKNPDFLLK